MATALVEGVISAGTFEPSTIGVTDVFQAAAQQLARKTGARFVQNNAALAHESEAMVLCVKPTDVGSALAPIAGDCAEKLMISIAAGTTLKTLASLLPAARLIRVMPNTPAMVQKGAAAFALGETATAADAALAEKIFSSVGIAFRVEEDLLDAVTGLSGSGPAYIYVVIDALAQGGVESGLTREVALALAAQTVLGAAEMVLKTGMPPTELKAMVTSPNGTTLAGLNALDEEVIRAAFSDAVRAAADRSRELGAS